MEHISQTRKTCIIIQWFSYDFLILVTWVNGEVCTDYTNPVVIIIKGDVSKYPTINEYAPELNGTCELSNQL
jgi:hypothetical protein